VAGFSQYQKNDIDTIKGKELKARFYKLASAIDHKVSPSKDFSSLYAKVDTGLSGINKYLPYYRQFDHPIITSGNFVTAHYNPYLLPSGLELGYHQFDGLFLQYDSLEMNISSIPLTRIEYANGNPQQQAFNLYHNQVLQPNLKLGIYYNRYASKGIFDNQASELTNIGATLFGFDLKRKYHWFAGYLRNHINLRENGGIERLMENNGNSTFVLNPFIDKSLSRRNNQGLHFKHYYDFGGNMFSVMLNDSDYYCNSIPNYRVFQELNYIKEYYSYSDEGQVDDFEGLYNINYYNSSMTQDSFWLNKLEHRIGFQSWINSQYVSIDTLIDTFRRDTTMRGFERTKEKFWWSGSSGQSYNVYGSYYVNDIWENLYNIDVLLKARFLRLNGQHLSSDLKYYLFGFNAGNYNYNLMLSNSLRKIDYSIHLYTRSNNPSLLMNQFYGNHFRWINDFSSIQDKSLMTNIKLKPYNFSAEISYRRINNYVYFNKLAIPTQHNGLVSYTRFRLVKQFKWGIINLKESFNINIQHSGSYYLRLPKWETLTALFAEGKVFRRKLWFQIGVQQSWTQAYKGYAYIPETGQFFIQDDYDVQLMPRYDAFFNWKVQHARFFISLENIFMWPEMIGPISFDNRQRDYQFSVVHHPIYDTQFQLRFGIKWKFYY